MTDHDSPTVVSPVRPQATTLPAASRDDSDPARSALGSALGPAVLVVLALVALSGLAIGLHYFPATDTAHESIRILDDVNDWVRGARSAHHFGAIAVVGLLIAQMAWILLRAGYRGRGRWGWWVLVGLLFTLVFADVTGGLLPWDERAWHATDVRLGIAAGSPLIGDRLGTALRGGDAVSAPTLVRFYAMHLALIPLAVGALLLFWQRRTARSAPPRGGRAVLPAVLAVAAACGLIAWAWHHHAPLGELAAPGETGFEARPEWYMLWLFELLRLGGADLQVVFAYGIPGALVGWLLLVPLLDRKAGGPSGPGRKFVLGTAALWTVALVGLSVPPLLDWPENRDVVPQPRDLDAEQRAGYLLVRTQGCCDCHAVRVDGTLRWFPAENEDRDEDVVSLTEARDNAEGLESFELIVRDPFGELMTEDMPSYDHLTSDQIRAIYRFIGGLPE